MSILLSAYFPEGIVFAADKNVTILYESSDGSLNQDVEVAATTKVLPWPYSRAIVGYCGLGELAGLSLDEWMRQFISANRDFDDLNALALKLKKSIQRDFERDYPKGTDIRQAGLIVHLGGFRYDSGIAIPAMFYISNVPGFDECGKYENAGEVFNGPSDEMAGILSNANGDYKNFLKSIYQNGKLVWFNNGLYFKAFNLFKEALWQVLTIIRESPCGFLPETSTLDDRVAYCKMAVELFGSFFQHHFLTSECSVGGGADAVFIPWPEK